MKTFAAQAFSTPEEALEHFGVKGMHWGERKEEPGTAAKSKLPTDVTGNAIRKDGSLDKKKRAKQIAIGVGVLALVAGAGYATYKLNQSGNLPLSSIKNTAAKKVGEEAVKKSFTPPTDIIHLARGKNIGLTFLRKGETPDYFTVFDKLGMNTNEAPTVFERATDGSGAIAARFKDHLDRTDFAGRPIRHDVVIPKNMTDGINNLSDVESKIWPLVKDTYDAFYETSLKSRA